MQRVNSMMPHTLLKPDLNSRNEFVEFAVEFTIDR